MIKLFFVNLDFFFLSWPPLKSSHGKEMHNDVIDENCFHNCVSPFSSGVNKRILVPIMKTGLDNIVNKTQI